MKFGAGHPFADPEAAARKRSLAASSPIYRPFLCDASGTARNFERDWNKRHESGTHVRLTGVSTESDLCYSSSAKPSALPLGCFRWSRPALNRSQVQADQAREKHDRRGLEG